MALSFIVSLSDWKPWYLTLVFFLGLVSAQTLPQSPDGELVCVSSSFTLTVVEVEGSNSKLIPIPIPTTSQIRPPRPYIHPSYNSLLIEVDGISCFIIPDTNLLRIIDLKRKTEDTVQLSSCEPLLLRHFEAVPNEIWILCNPDGVDSSVHLYRIVYENDQWGTAGALPLLITSTNGSLLMDVGVIFRRNEEVYVAVATPTEIVWITPEKNVRETQSISGCGTILQIAEFSNESLVIECGQKNGPSRTVQTTLIYDLDTADTTGSILQQDRTSGKIFFSEDRQIIGSVSADRIVMEWLNNGESPQILSLIPVNTKEFHDAFIETTNGKYTLLYSQSGGGVYSYNITAALVDGNVVSQMITSEEEKVCEQDCVSLLSLGSGFFATGLSEPEGVGWYSLSPRRKVGFASGAPSARLAFSPAESGPAVVVVDEGLSGGRLGGVVGAVVGSLVMLLLIVVVAMVATISLLRSWKKRSRLHGTYTMEYEPQTESVHIQIRNNFEPQSPVPETDNDKELPSPVQETHGDSSIGSSQESDSHLVPGTMPPVSVPGVNDGTRIGQDLEAHRVATKEAELA